jgi:FkbM family methyltransferase
VTDFPEFNRLKQCRHGLMLYNRNDLYVGRSLDLYGEYSEGELDLLRHWFGPGDVGVEVGANLGAHTVPLARIAGPQGAVLALEPQRLMFQTLCANLALNNLPNVVCFQEASGAQTGTLIVPLLDPTIANNFGGLALGSFQKGQQVRVTPLDAYALPKCQLLKVDVEGMEEDVLRGAADTIARCQPTLYVENDRQDKAQSLVRYIASLGYRMYGHYPALFNAANFLGNQENVFPEVVSKNLLCVHRNSVRPVFQGMSEIFPW